MRTSFAVVPIVVSALTMMGCAHPQSIEPRAADNASAPTATHPPDPPRSDLEGFYPWIAPVALAAESTGAVAIAHANGMSFGRIAGDATGGSIGAGLGLVGAFLLNKYGRNDQDFARAALLIPIASIAVALGGVAIGEAASGHEPLPERTVWPATGGLAVGVAFDLGALIAEVTLPGDHEAAGITTGVLAPIALGTSMVAGFSMASPAK